MKKLIAFLLLACMMLTALASCGKTTDDPTPGETTAPTTNKKFEAEMIPAEDFKPRDVVVAYMEKMSQVKWTPKETINLNEVNNGLVYKKGVEYTGIMYITGTNSQSNLDKFLSQLDENGVYVGPTTRAEGYGNHCSSSIRTAYNQISNVPTFATTVQMVPSKNRGTLPVGDYVFSADDVTTDTIIAKNPAERSRITVDYKDGSLGFTDTTAGDLIESGELGADSAVNVDAFAAGIMVAPEGDDNALKLGNAYGKAGYIYLNSLTNSGKHYVLEADLKLDRASSSRTDKIAFQLWGSTTKSSNTAYFGIGASITVEDGKLYFVASVNNGEGNTTKIELTPEVWYNVRIDIADVTTGGDVKYYLNGTLVHTGTTDKKTSSLASMVIWMPDKTSGILHLDNVYFGALDPVADEPEQPGDTPATAGRGNGAYADNDNTLTYTDTTATALGEAGKLITSGTGTLDGATMSASVELVDGDSALKLSNNAYNSEAYFNIQADALGSKYVFETDIMFTGAGSGRSDNNYEFLAFYSSNSQAASIATHWNGMPQARLCVVSNSDSTTTYSLMCGDKQVSLNEGEWFNIRYEFKNMSTTGNEIRVYVNGELLYTGSNTKTTSALRFIRVHIPAKTQGSIYLDNTYYSAITAE